MLDKCSRTQAKKKKKKSSVFPHKSCMLMEGGKEEGKEERGTDEQTF
jgi:hypothetical protein